MQTSQPKFYNTIVQIVDQKPRTPENYLDVVRMISEVIGNYFAHGFLFGRIEWVNSCKDIPLKDVPIRSIFDVVAYFIATTAVENFGKWEVQIIVDCLIKNPHGTACINNQKHYLDKTIKLLEESKPTIKKFIEHICSKHNLDEERKSDSLQKMEEIVQVLKHHIYWTSPLIIHFPKRYTNVLYMDELKFKRDSFNY